MSITKILARSGAEFALQERAFRSWLQLVSTPCQNITLFPAKQLTQESQPRDSSSNDPTQHEFSLTTWIDFPMKKKGHFFTLPRVLWLPWTLATDRGDLRYPCTALAKMYKTTLATQFFFLFSPWTMSSFPSSWGDSFRRRLRRFQSEAPNFDFDLRPSTSELLFLPDWKTAGW